MTMAFAEEEFQARIERVVAELGRQDLDALVVTGPENICYLSGFWTPGYHVFQALVVPRKSEPFLVVRNIEVDSVESKSAVKKAYQIQNLDYALQTFVEAMRAEGIEGGRVGLEVDLAKQTTIRTDLLSDLLGDVTWVPSVALVDAFRAIKSETEVAYIRKAVSLAESALKAGAASIPQAATDSDVAAAVHFSLAAAGSEFTGSPPYAVEGLASARTHSLHANRPLDPEGHVWMEVSASVNRYHGVVSRIGGRNIRSEIARHFEVSAQALTKMVKAMRDGIASGAVDAIGREVVDRHDCGKYWKNRAAYSLGLSFPPGLGEGHIIDIKTGDERILRSGMVFHMIPILKVPGLGAIGCTETVMVTPEGGERLGTLDLAPLGGVGP
jgi:Xaa-Pro dipeptidase